MYDVMVVDMSLADGTAEYDIVGAWLEWDVVDGSENVSVEWWEPGTWSVDGEVLHIRNLTLDVSVVRVHFDIRMHELEVNRSVVAPWMLIEWFSHPEWPRHFSRGADVQPSIVTRGPYSASVEVTPD